MNKIVFISLALVLFIGCKGKKKDKPETPAQNFFVNDYIKGQVARLDTSMYGFQKIEIENGHSDTTSIRNKEVKNYAKDFLELPDLAKDDLKDDYEVTHLYDDLQEAFVFTFSTKEPHPIKQQYVTVEMGFNEKGQNDIRSVYVDYEDSKNGTTVQKRMMWEQTNFYVTTITNTVGQEQKIKTVKIIWKNFQ